MKKMRFALPVLFCLLGAGFSAGAVHIGYLYPAGARQGTLVEVLVGGQALWGVSGVRVTGGGVTCEGIDPVPNYPYPYEKQRRYIVACLKARLENRPLPARPDMREGWRPNASYDRIADLSPRAFELAIHEFFVRPDSLQLNPAIQSKVLLRLRVAPDAKPGRRELRLMFRRNREATNPLPFYVSNVPEVTEEPFRMPPQKAPPTAFQAPCVLNGQIRPGETDRFTFTAHQGEFLSFRATARSLYPFQGDCVPGHTQLVLEIFDAAGHSVAFADDDAFRPDPILEHRFAKTGKYTLAVRDALYRGRDDFTYRIDVTRQRRVVVPPLPPDPVLPVTPMEKAPVVIRSPVMLRGTLSKKLPRSCRFYAAKGRVVMLEVWARRLGSPLDPVLTVRDSRGKILRQVDDTPRLRIGENLQRSADPCCRFEVPATGEYTVTVADVAGYGGHDAGFYLRIDRPRPDFRLYAAPSYLNSVWGSGSNYLIRVEPLDGFKGEIKLSLAGPAAERYELGAVDTLPAGADAAWITIKPKSILRQDRLREAVPLQLVGTAGRRRRVTVPCHSDMQAFAYTHWLPVEEMLVGSSWGVNWEGGFGWSAGDSKKYTLKRGKHVILKAFIKRTAPKSGFRKLGLTCLNPRADLKIEAVRDPQAAAAVKVTALPVNAQTAKLPAAENLVFQFSGEYDNPPDRKGKVQTVSISFPLEVVQLKMVP